MLKNEGGKQYEENQDKNIAGVTVTLKPKNNDGNEYQEYQTKTNENGDFEISGFIPNEYELAEIYNVSRPTIRKAVQILVDEGYLEKRKKRGTIVCDPTIRQEFAQVIQTFDKEVKEKGLTPSTKVLTFKQEKAEEEVRQKLNLKETEKV